tara:strand:- start:997 stop:1482 length:486 start_codon:yes stop_codon:yes gene_type:complete
MLDILESLLDEMEPSKTSSRLLKYAGITASTQSLVIKTGNKLEAFWNLVVPQLDDSATARQVDFFFEKEGVKYYYELKCNTGLDSEKLKASNAKVEQVTRELGADIAGYFNPASPDDYYEAKIKKDVVGVRSMIQLLDPPFTAEEYEEVLARKLKEKLSLC